MDIRVLEKALAHGRGEMTLEDVLALAELGRMQVYKVDGLETFMVTEVVKYPRKLRLRVVLIAGEFSEKVVEFAESLAKGLGADGIELSGRKGWVRRLEKFGYEPTTVNVVKDFL